jgi:hypothetical protein
VIPFSALKEMEARKEDTLLAEKIKIEMDKKIEEIADKISALEQNCAVLDDGIKQKTAKKEIVLSGIMQVYLVALGLAKSDYLSICQQSFKNYSTLCCSWIIRVFSSE